MVPPFVGEAGVHFNVQRTEKAVEEKQEQLQELSRKLRMNFHEASSDAAHDKGDAIRSRIDAASKKLQERPKAAALLASFQPTPVREVIADAEGNFALNSPRGEPLLIFAKNEQAGGEQYYWLVDAPSEDKPAPVLLGNANLAEVGGFNELHPPLKDQPSSLPKRR